MQFFPTKFYQLSYKSESKNIFIADKNYKFLLQKYFLYTKPVAETFAFCLLPQSFDFLFKIKNEEEILQIFNFQQDIISPKFQEKFILKHLNKQFANFLNDYKQEFLENYNDDKLFSKENFKILEVSQKADFTKILKQIHLKPEKEGFVNKFEDWQYSSYNQFFAEESTDIKTETIIKYFSNIYNFRDFHQKSDTYKGV